MYYFSNILSALWRLKTLPRSAAPVAGAVSVQGGRVPLRSPHRSCPAPCLPGGVVSIRFAKPTFPSVTAFPVWAILMRSALKMSLHHIEGTHQDWKDVSSLNETSFLLIQLKSWKTKLLVWIQIVGKMYLRYLCAAWVEAERAPWHKFGVSKDFTQTLAFIPRKLHFAVILRCASCCGRAVFLLLQTHTFSFKITQCVDVWILILFST